MFLPVVFNKMGPRAALTPAMRGSPRLSECLLIEEKQGRVCFYDLVAKQHGVSTLR